jgi:hypothetical protein
VPPGGPVEERAFWGACAPTWSTPFAPTRPSQVVPHPRFIFTPFTPVEEQVVRRFSNGDRSPLQILQSSSVHPSMNKEPCASSGRCSFGHVRRSSAASLLIAVVILGLSVAGAGCSDQRNGDVRVAPSDVVPSARTKVTEYPDGHSRVGDLVIDGDDVVAALAVPEGLYFEAEPDPYVDGASGFERVGLLRDLDLTCVIYLKRLADLHRYGREVPKGVADKSQTLVRVEIHLLIRLPRVSQNDSRQPVHPRPERAGLPVMKATSSRRTGARGSSFSRRVFGGGREGVSDLADVDVGVRGRQAGEIVFVAGEDHAAAGFDGGRHDVRVGQVRGIGAGGRQDSADVASEGPVGVAHVDPGLATEAGVDDLVVARAAVQLGEDHGGGHDFALQPAGRLECGPDLTKARATLAGKV